VTQLESSRLFIELPPNEAAVLKTLAHERKFAAGEVIFREGEVGDGMYVIAEGAVQISSKISFGDSCVLSLFHEGDHFGEMAVLDDDTRSATAIAQEPTRVYFIERMDLLHIIDKTPRLALAFVREISRRLREFNHHYIRDVLESERLALVGRFAGSIVHDLKTPLNIIGLSAELSCRSTATPEMRIQYKERINKQVDRISNMVNELLEFTRGSQTSFILARMSYADFVRQVITEFRPEIATKGVTIQLENDPPDILTKINPPRLTRVFHNLIVNATDAMPNGGTITLRFQLKGSELITEIRDTGKGIAPEMKDRLFQAFATYGKANGTGLGLSICKKIILDHQGRIFAQNAATGGAVFGFAIPIEPPTT